jgi:hypothetical protein
MKDIRSDFTMQTEHHFNPDLLRFLKYLEFKLSCAAYQFENPVRLDMDLAVRCRDELLKQQEEKVLQLQEVMPKMPLKVSKANPPKITHKKDGTPSKKFLEWQQLLRERKLPAIHKDTIETVLEWQDGNPNSTDQVKSWLYSLGWKPCTFKFMKNKETGEERQIEQVRKDGELTDSVLRLKETTPEVEILEGLTIIQHRLGVFQGFIDSAIERNGGYYLRAEIGGLTNTLRFKHKKPLVNLPGVDKPWGEEIRSCLIAEEGKVFIGCDMVSLEDTTKRHYMKPLDPDYVEEMSQEGYDPHLSLALFAGDITQEEYDTYGETKDPHITAIRKAYKVTNYCLPMYTEVLTKLGWKTFDQIEVGETLPVYNQFEGVVYDGVVAVKHFYQKTPVVRCSNSNTSFVCTPNHKWYSKKRVNTRGTKGYFKYGYTETKELKTEDNLLMAAPYEGDVNGNVTSDEAMLLGFILSDGYYKWSIESSGPSTSKGSRRNIVCMVSQSKNKFYKEVEGCLERLGLSYRKDEKSVSNGNTVFNYYLKCEEARDFFDRVTGCRLQKYELNWTSWVMGLNRSALESFYEGFFMGDGTQGENLISQNEGNIFDAVVATTQLLGKGRVLISGNGKCRHIRRGRSNNLTWQKIKVEEVPHKIPFV